MSNFKGFSDVQIIQEEEEESEPVKTLGKKTVKNSPKRTNVIIKSKKVESPVAPEAFLSPNNHPQDSTNPDILSGVSSSTPPNLEESKEAVDNLSKIELMELRQRQIEEENKRKRQLLQKAISERRQRTSDEAKKLSHVQGELQKIDLLVANDVKILRQTIEVACVDYLEAQKRYDFAEKEFVDAKLNLHMKLERKELLTEHLMTIIEESETRKAKKLSQLMEELKVSDVDL